MHVRAGNDCGHKAISCCGVMHVRAGNDCAGHKAISCCGAMHVRAGNDCAGHKAVSCCGVISKMAVITYNLQDKITTYVRLQDNIHIANCCSFIIGEYLRPMQKKISYCNVTTIYF